jgi:hypothetical protein
MLVELVLLEIVEGAALDVLVVEVGKKPGAHTTLCPRAVGK